MEESKHTELNRDFKAAISACRVEFMKSGGSLSVITKDPTSQRRAGMLQEMHFRFEEVIHCRWKETGRNLELLQTYETVEGLVEMCALKIALSSPQEHLAEGHAAEED